MPQDDDVDPPDPSCDENSDEVDVSELVEEYTKEWVVLTDMTYLSITFHHLLVAKLQQMLLS